VRQGATVACLYRLWFSTPKMAGITWRNRADDTAYENKSLGGLLDRELAGIALLGNIAIVAGLKRRVEWDSAAMRGTNLPELNRCLKPTVRNGWSI